MVLDEILRPKETEMTRAVKARCNSLIATLKKDRGDNAFLMVQGAIFDYGQRMREKYGALCEKVEAFHALIGSGLPVGRETIEDFPALEDSVAMFLDDLEKRLLGPETV